MRSRLGASLTGLCVGTLNGLFGAGGGMVLVPLLGKCTDLQEEDLFPAGVCILFPICLVSLVFSKGWQAFSWLEAAPYLLGSAIGGVAAGILGKKIPNLWLHRGLGILIIWGGVRYLW